MSIVCNLFSTDKQKLIRKLGVGDNVVYKPAILMFMLASSNKFSACSHKQRQSEYDIRQYQLSLVDPRDKVVQ